ncbi:hypothetical protein BBO99_00000513 [Phytophthora kernoviae]|uniref:U-box domain-containing protein n=2 Tax=Phytophthora kernoviae TaxID=325452 RepID=A0A3R7H369_9STRA|nr:hypothetical protein G195_001501 [Phytophthora kernoviae 00238/432]KAG2532098.1 hypothetical protein JM16_000550 [Phytophthora kernoviae]KAG2533200.1 hypothetical protein JM18_000631 [Phytophthora kernoviae]RLN26076.1 hypothetical protein BBI17_000552 [Phytophthora kernoviae]RLN85440.1 hypothetical protein BBO99_00000513 [Phytophthora kernoviae]
MGGAASTQASFEQMLACTMILGDAMVQGLDPRFVRFPDLYRLYDFHIGPKNPRDQASGFKGGNMLLIVRSPDADGKFQQLQLENGETIKTSAEKNADSDTAQVLADDQETNHLIVYMGNDKVVLDKTTLHQPNNDGWTPLHSACHMLTAQEAGIAILKELISRKADLNLVTRRGPGSFSCGWTALHIACAYGLEALAIKLIRAGANVNTTNSVGWTPLYDVCHRGYTTVAQELLRAGAKHDVICPEFALCPFPGQFPLAEAARQGHASTVKMLLEWGINKNMTNKLGWTALHEAAYHSRVPIVKLLVVYGHPKKATALSRKEEYELLGDLPSLNAITIQDADSIEENEEDAEAKAPIADSPPKENEQQKKKHRDPSKKKKKKKAGAQDIPPEFKCAVSLKLMKKPLRSPFGQVFERQVIEAWFRDFGNRCPLTGQPLTLQELVSDDKLREEIHEWKHGPRKSKPSDADAKESNGTLESKEAVTPASEQDDEYAF